MSPSPNPSQIPRRQLAAFVLSAALKLAIPYFRLWPGHWVLSLALFTAPDVWILTGLLLPNARWMMPTVTHFKTTQRQVWLTIDDGPDPQSTPAVLNLLEARGAKATFFLIGSNVEKHPELAAEIVRRGHSVGNHTYGHPLATFWLAGPARTLREVARCQDALKSANVGETLFFRAPVGIKTLFLWRSIGRFGMLNIGWTVRGREQFSRTPDQPLRRLTRRAKPGAILLLHESGARADVKLSLLSQLLEHLGREQITCVIPKRESLG